MRLFVALGIVAVALLALAAVRVTRHHRRVTPAPVADDVEVDATTPAPPSKQSAAPPTGHTWSGPTLHELLDKAEGPATIGGHARGPEGVAISVRAAPVGRRERGRRVRVENGEFQIPGLVFGRSYDLIFEGRNLRQTTLRSVTAPADAVEATLEPLPVLRGAIGFPAGGVCAYDHLVLRAGGGGEPEDLVDIGLDDDCRFELTVPDGPTQMVLVATGNAPQLEMPLTLPPVGDPEPVCLNPPCRADPLADRARLRISFAGPDHDVSATLVIADGDGSSSYNCFASGESCELDALPTGPPLKLVADSSDCATATRTIVLHAGDNDVSFPCELPTSVTATVAEPLGIGDLEIQETYVVE